MHSLRRASTVVLVVLLMAALVAPGALAKQPKEVPLKGDFVGSGVDFSGNFSHLGRFTGVITGANPTTAEWTAANGDTVTNESVITSFDPETGAYVQEITITGGTGRFADATGSATVTGTIFGVDAYDGHLEGTISQPGPRKDK